MAHLNKYKYKLLIFDWDGTLMDSANHIVNCVQAAARDLNLPEPSVECIRRGVGLSFDDQLKNLFPEQVGGGVLDRHAFRERYEYYFYNAGSDDCLQLMEGATELLQQLKSAGFLLAIATSMQQAVLENMLTRFDMIGLFNAIRCGDQTLPKPHPQMLFEILDELAVDNKASLMIGDTKYDMSMAQRAGMDRVAVSYGVHSIESLREFRPIACIDRLSSLFKFV